jgi:hypothetical protein
MEQARMGLEFDFRGNLTRKLLNFTLNAVSHHRRSAHALLTLASSSTQVT